MTFVKSPVLVHRDIALTKFSSYRVKSHDCTSQNRGVSDIELKTFLLKQLTSMLSLLETVLSQCDIGPASETVLLVPSRLTMSNEDDLEYFVC